MAMETNNELKISAGLVIIYDNKILLEHPTGAKWVGTYGIPKGEVKQGEDLFEAAMRETIEELGIAPNSLNLGQLISQYPGQIDYANNGLVYKTIYYFIFMIDKPLIIDQAKLQKEEVDWAGFLTKEEAEKKIFWRQKEVLNFLK